MRQAGRRLTSATLRSADNEMAVVPRRASHQPGSHGALRGPAEALRDESSSKSRAWVEEQHIARNLSASDHLIPWEEIASW